VTALNNNAEGGTHEEHVTVANSGGASGNAFTAVTEGPGGWVTFDNSVTVDGGMAYKFFGRSWAYFTWPAPAGDHVAGRIDLYLPSPGPVDPGFGHGGGGGLIWQYLKLNSPGVILYTADRDWADDSHSSVAPTPTRLVCAEVGESALFHSADGALPLDQWFRIEFDFTVSNPGAYDVRIYPTQWATDYSARFTGTRTWANPGGAPGNTVYIGPESSVSIGDPDQWFFADNININSTGMPGPSSDGWVNIAGATAGTLAFKATMPLDGTWYRAKFHSSGGDAVSAAAMLTVIPGDLPDDSDDFPDDSLPDAVAPAEGPGSATVLDLIRQFSTATRRAVRLVGPSTIQMCDPNAPLPAGIAAADANDMYHSSTRQTLAGAQTLSLEENELSLSATAEFTSDDPRVPASAWRIPDQLPVYGLRPGLVQRVSYTFTPDHYSGSVEFFYPLPLSITRRS
jgi:hypothetical protein